MDVRFVDGSSELYEDKSFARGAEGDVFRSMDGLHVVKLYYPHAADANRIERLRELIQRRDEFAGDSVWAELFAWPDKIVESPRLGVRLRNMTDDIRMDHYLYQASFEDLPPVKRGSWLGRVATSIKLARAIAK